MGARVSGGEDGSVGGGLPAALALLKTEGLPAALEYAKALAFDSECDVALLHFAGVWSVDVEDFPAAIKYLNMMFQSSDSTGVAWYQESALCVRAFAYINVGEFSLAEHDLALLPEDANLLILQNTPAYTKTDLLRSIKNKVKGVRF